MPSDFASPIRVVPLPFQNDIDILLLSILKFSEKTTPHCPHNILHLPATRARVIYILNRLISTFDGRKLCILILAHAEITLVKHDL